VATENLQWTETAQIGLPYLDSLIRTSWSKILRIGWISKGICRKIWCINSLDCFPVFLIFIFMCDGDRMISIVGRANKRSYEWRIIEKYGLKLLSCVKWEQVNNFKIVVHIANTHLRVMWSVQKILSISRKSRRKNVLRMHRYRFEEFNHHWSPIWTNLVNWQIYLTLRDNLCPIRRDSKNILYGAILNRAEIFDSLFSYLVDADGFSRFWAEIKSDDKSVRVRKEI